MSKPGRKPLAIPRVRKAIFLRLDLAAELDLLLLDPMREKVAYGAYVKYFEALVEKDIAERRLKQGQPKFETELDRFEKEMERVFSGSPVWDLLKPQFERFRQLSEPSS